MSLASVEEEIGVSYEDTIYREPVIADDHSDVSEPYDQEIQAEEVSNFTYESMLGMCNDTKNIL